MLEYTKKKFAKDLIKVIKRYQADCSPVFDQSESEIKFNQADSKNENVIRLDNIYHQWKNLPRKERIAKIDAFVKPMFHPVERSADQRMAMLRLRARSVEEISNRDLIDFDKELKPTLYPKGALILELVEDSESTVSLVDQENLDTLQLDKNQAFNMAAAAMVRETGANQWKALGKIWYSTNSDDYDFARLVAAGSDAHLPFNTDKAVVYAPSHAVCIVCDAPNSENLAQMISVGDQMSENQRILSKRLWTQNSSGHWVYFENSADAEISRMLKMQEVLDNTNNYTEQKNLLDKIHEKENTDIFVANYVGMQNQNNEIVSMCTYTVNLPSLLPVTDLVNVYHHESESVLCTLPWTDFGSIVAQRMKQHGEHVPARYALLNELSETQIDMLKQQN